MKLCNRLTVLCLMAALVVPAASLAELPFEELRGAELSVDIDWEGSRNLLFYGLPKNRVVPGTNELQVRVSKDKTPLFFESVVFEGTLDRSQLPPAPRGDKAFTPDFSKRGVELFSLHTEELTALFEDVRQGGDIQVSLQLNGETVFEGRLRRLMKGSDSLRAGSFIAMPITSSLKDLRPVAEAQGFDKVSCDDCDSDYADCQVDFCYWDYDEYMCNTGCDLEYDACSAMCTNDPPSCTPATLSTSTSNQLISSVFNNYSVCVASYNPYAWDTLYDLYYLTYRQTTTETRRLADCSIQQVNVGTSYFSVYCYQYTGRYCSFGSGAPSCTF